MKQKESDSKLATARNDLEETIERIKELQEEHDLLQEKLEMAESQVSILQQKLEAAEKDVHTLQIELDTLKAQISEDKDELRAEFAAGMQDLRTEMIEGFKVQMATQFKALVDQNSVTEQRCNDLEEQLTTAQVEKADVVNNLEASRQTEKATLDEAQRREQEHQQQLNNVRAEEKAQRDHLSEQNAREQKKLHEDLTKARENSKVSEEQLKSDLEVLRSELTTAESQKQVLEIQLEKASRFEKKYSKAVADAIPLRKELAATTQKIQTQTNKCLTLSGLKDVAKERCVELERDNEAIQASLKQQQDANSNLVAAQRAQLSRETQHANRLQREVDGLRAEMQDKDNELREARVDKANLTEKFNDDARIAAAKSRKLLQEELSKKKIQQEQTESHTQNLKDELLVCQRKLELMTQNNDCLKEDSDAERDCGVREYSDFVQTTKDVVERFREEFEQRCKGLYDLRASLATAESLEAEELDGEDGSTDESTPEETKKRNQRVRAGLGGRITKAVTALARGESIKDMELTDLQRFVATNTQARALEPPRTDRSNQQTRWLEHCYNQHQQTTPQVVATNTSRPAEAPSPLQPQTALVATANEFQPAPVATQPPQQGPAGLRGELQHQPSGQIPQLPQQRIEGLSRSQHQHDQPLQLPQPRFQGLGDSRWA